MSAFDPEQPFAANATCEARHKTIDWSSLSTGYGLRLRCGKPFIHAGRTLRLVGMLGAGTLSGSEPFHRRTSALEEGDDGPQDSHGDDRGQGCGGYSLGRCVHGESPKVEPVGRSAL